MPWWSPLKDIADPLALVLLSLVSTLPTCFSYCNFYYLCPGANILNSLAIIASIIMSVETIWQQHIFHGLHQELACHINIFCQIKKLRGGGYLSPCGSNIDQNIFIGTNLACDSVTLFVIIIQKIIICLPWWQVWWIQLFIWSCCHVWGPGWTRENQSSNTEKSHDT